MELVGDFVQWLGTIDRTFAFLLALPFVVAIAGLVAHRILRGER